MAGCTDCYFGGVKVGYGGDETSSFVIVGEAPRALDVAKRKPFSDPTGDLLFRVLKEFESELSVEPFLTNALNCLPRQKDPKKVANACKRCHGRLHEEITRHPRKVILALGNAALWSLTGDYSHKITKVRGEVFDSEYAECGIVASVHPSYILRGGGNLSQFKRDILYAIQLHEDSTSDIDADDLGEEARPVIRAVGQFKPSEYKILDTPSTVAALAVRMSELTENDFIGADFETDGFDPRNGSGQIDGKAYIGEDILCLGISFEKDMTYVIPGNMIIDELFQSRGRYTWHNGKFDLGWARAKGFPSARVDEDTMLMSYTLNEVGGIHDLEQVGKDWLNAENFKDMLDKYKPSKKHSYAFIPKPVLYKYQAIDANLTFALAEPMRKRVDLDARLSRMYQEILIPATEFLYHLERDGFQVDLNQVESNRVSLLEICEGEERIFGDMSESLSGGDAIWGGAKKTARANIQSPLQVKQLLYGHLKLGKMGMSTDAKTLEKLPDHPIVMALRKHRKTKKLLSTYVIPAEARSRIDGRLHTTFKIHGTTTGRLSSTKPNLQNIPRNEAIRGQFITPPGRVVLECDLSQAELRMLAQLSKDVALCAIFNNDSQSLHDEVAIYLFGEGFTKDQKVAAKCVNFGIVYGITAAGLAERVSYFTGRPVTMDEAAKWISDWAARFPQAWIFIQRCRDAVMSNKTLVSAFGRKRRFNVVTGERLQGMQNEAANFPHQSGASDITLLSGIELRPLIRDEFDAIIVNTVHDCLVCDIPDDMRLVIPCARKIVTAMEAIPRKWGLDLVPFKAEAEIGYRWGKCIGFNPYDKKYDNLTGECDDDFKTGNYFDISSAAASGLLDAIYAME